MRDPHCRMSLAGLVLLVSLCDLVTSEAALYPAPSYCPAPQVRHFEMGSRLDRSSKE